MRASRKQDSILHEIIFKTKIDIAPRYTKDFQHSALFLEMLLLEEKITEVSIGFDPATNLWYAQITFETPFDKITVKKLEKSKELALCSAAMSFYGGRQ